MEGNLLLIIIIPEIKYHLFVAIGVVTLLHTRNNTDGNKLMV